MKLTKLKPAVVTTLWGGKKLLSWGKETKEDHISETWELSFYKDHPCTLEDGTPLMDVVTDKELGTNVSKFEIFPLLVKFIDSAQDLSVQVHPSDEYALKHEGELGKTEMWQILEAEDGCGIYLGFNKETSEEEVIRKVEDGSILELLNFFEVKKGETYFIPSGTVHAIGKGVTLIEIQQNSNITYRLYDYKRKDKNGNYRELHLDKAVKVIDYHKFEPISFAKPLLGECKYFKASLYPITNNEIIADFTSFKAIHIIEGEGNIGEYAFKKGDTFFLPADSSVRIEGKGEMVITEVPAC